MGNETKNTEVVEKEEVPEEVEDGIKDEIVEENSDTESGKEDAADPDRVPGDGDGGEGVKDDAEKGGEDEEPAQPTLEERFKALEEELRVARENKKEAPEKEEAKIPEKTAEEWQALADTYEMPVKAVQALERNQIDFAKRTVQFVRNEIAKAFGSTNREKAIEGMSSKFKDIGNYKNGINEFLQNYKIEDHSNPVLLEKAYYYARGKGVDKLVKKVRESTELNRKVVKRVASTKGNTNSPKAGKANLRLSEQEESTWEAFGKHNFDSKEEYARSLPRNRGK